MPRLEIIEAAAPASRAVEKARRFIIMVSLLRHAGWWERLNSMARDDCIGSIGIFSRANAASPKFHAGDASCQSVRGK
jgi:hypothetical protein